MRLHWKKNNIYFWVDINCKLGVEACFYLPLSVLGPHLFSACVCPVLDATVFLSSYVQQSCCIQKTPFLKVIHHFCSYCLSTFSFTRALEFHLRLTVCCKLSLDSSFTVGLCISYVVMQEDNTLVVNEQNADLWVQQNVTWVTVFCVALVEE